jgi:hypothetical protein
MCWPMSKYSNFMESMEGSCLQVRVRGAVDQWEHDYDLGQASWQIGNALCESAGSLPDSEIIRDLETTIQKLRLGNYSARFRN